MANSPTLLCILLAIIICVNDAVGVGAQQFIYNGFKDTNLSLGGAASITQDGILSLTSNGSDISGYGFHREPLLMVDHDGNTSTVPSFSATIVFTVTPYFSGSSSDEMAFVISSTPDISSAALFAIALGGNLQNPVCIRSACYSYANDDLYSVGMVNLGALRLSSGKPVQLWADYNGTSMELNVFLVLVPIHDPSPPLLYYKVNMSRLLLGNPPAVAYAYAGFSASNNITTYQVLGWSFSLGGGPAQPLSYSLLPSLGVQPTTQEAKKTTTKDLVKWLPATISVLTVLVGITAAWLVLRCRRNKRKEKQQEEGWEAELGPRRFSHNVLRKATSGFSSRQLLGQGGFGRVYGGALAASGTRVAVKRISSESKQGLVQFMAEIVILGRLRHRNLVRLIGYCRHKDELLLVYEHMPNGSLDRYLHGKSKDSLIWSQRLRVIKGVASGLLYLHEDWEQVIVHRDVKASNVLLDAEMNGRLGDFGLARLHDHGTDPHTTHIAGTRGYLAPELLRFGKATKATDVFAFGMFILEVACGRRPLGLNARRELLELANWVPQVWTSRSIIDAMDPRLEDYVVDEAELVLKLGLLCSHPLPTARPGMRLVMQYLDGDLPLPEFSPDYLAITDLDQVLEASSSVATTMTGLSGGR